MLGSLGRRAAGLVPLLALLLIAGFSGCGRAETAVRELQRMPIAVVTADGARHAYDVEVALTSDEQAKGLMYRQTMARDRGMIFVFSSPRNAYFWMANTYIALDMIFIGPDGRIESILADVQPLAEDQRTSLGPVAAVLELNAGEAARIGAKPGDLVEYSLQDLQARPE